ncbi:zinc-dependent alcohol dehydrogenase family protein [Aspergillus ibericus CBS 121593]|uniref:NAD(P)-binding protein n=1 Tax=Aspergillus ibericus CBS 121593 TaxID=1448316 RepID=A0A395GM59_9EURO|nr:NAD(P)-binding protein [Aspergillus ibericus CBS 121593]RAK95917.1 NAD(P)-binding protein [Aspergillus ibericus CBS 121593]
MSSQTVLHLPSRESWTNLTESQEPIPTAGKHEVLIKIRSVALNFRDIAISTGHYPFPVKEQVVPGSDAAGDIVNVGEGVSDLQEGDKVMVAFDLATMYGPIKGWANSLGGPVDGVLREYIVVPAQAVVKIPESSSLSYAQWASVVCTGATAWNALYGNLPLRPGHSVLFLGTGGVSITGLVLAKAAGATTIITSSSDEKLRLVKEKYGVDHTINYQTTPNWAAEVQKITNGKGVDYILETCGAGTIQQSIDAIAYGGIISVIGFLAETSQEEMPNVAALVIGKGAVVRGIMIGSKQLLEEAVRFIGARDLPVPVEKTFQFRRDQVVEAYEYLASGQHVGKVCIEF